MINNCLIGIFAPTTPETLHIYLLEKHAHLRPLRDLHHSFFFFLPSSHSFVDLITLVSLYYLIWLCEFLAYFQQQPAV